jgi:hypothetical protein
MVAFLLFAIFVIVAATAIVWAWFYDRRNVERPLVAEEAPNDEPKVMEKTIEDLSPLETVTSPPDIGINSRIRIFAEVKRRNISARYCQIGSESHLSVRRVTSLSIFPLPPRQAGCLSHFSIHWLI